LEPPLIGAEIREKTYSTMRMSAVTPRYEWRRLPRQAGNGIAEGRLETAGTVKSPAVEKSIQRAGDGFEKAPDRHGCTRKEGVRSTGSPIPLELPQESLHKAKVFSGTRPHASNDDRISRT